MKIEDEIKGRFRSEYNKGLINLIFTTNRLHNQFMKELKKYELSPQMYNILRVLRGFRPVPCSIAFLKERMLDQSSDVSRIIDNLLSKKLIIRSENKDDRRQKDIEITDLALELLVQIDDTERNLDALLKNLDEQEIKTLNYLLDKIRD
ncbi:MAG TPA: MarR family transcriptional regulator [Bacteroidales bacterium]|nr:MarR family transcriptional regulator [Bacteroidales bacterium]